MQAFMIFIFAFIFSSQLLASQLNADDIFKLAKNLEQSLLENIDDKGDEVPIGGLIQRHPLLNHISKLFKTAQTSPSINQLQSGKTWNCLKFTGLDFQSELVKITTVRNLSFENFGAGIIKEVSYGTNPISIYAKDVTELAGITNSGELYEAIRLTEEGDLVLESSVQGISWWRKFFLSLIGEGRNLKKLLAVVQNTMAPSIANTFNNGFVFDYTVCPAGKIINDVVTR